jgi:uncharacterized protein YecT (DUF1311 family)
MCDGAAMNRMDAQINQVVKAIFREGARIDARLPQSGSFRGSARRRLIEAQRAWLAYSLADCASYGDVMAGGSAAVDLTADCLLRRSQERLRELRQLACWATRSASMWKGCLRRIAGRPIGPYAAP